MTLKHINMKHETQKQRIKEHLLKGKSLTPLQAFKKFGSMRLSGVIFKLKKEGLPIQTEIIQVKDKRVARYYIEK